MIYSSKIQTIKHFSIFSLSNNLIIIDFNKLKYNIYFNKKLRNENINDYGAKLIADYIKAN